MCTSNVEALCNNNVLHFVAGIISTKKILDRETHADFILTVAATDGGGLSCQAEVYVTVTDVNDNEPIFTQFQYTVAIPENAEVNTLLTRVSASDEDLGTLGLNSLPNSLAFVFKR